MKLEQLCLASALIVLSSTVSMPQNVNSSDSKPKVVRGPRPLRDRFRNIQRDLTRADLNAKIDTFESYGCEHMAVLSNEASSPIVLWCSSGDEDIKEIQVIPEESFAFTFRPKRNGKSVFQCVLNYEEKWATFPVYDEEEVYSVPRENSYIYRYSIRGDGIYMNNKLKIRSFLEVFDYSSDDDYMEDHTEKSDAANEVAQTLKAHLNMQELILPKKYRLAEAPKAIFDRFNAIRADVPEKDNLLSSTKPILDRFNIIRANLSKEDLRTELDDFANYDCERMVVLSNDASAPLRLWCSCGDENVREETVSIGRCFAFSFKPKHNGNSRFQCILDYRGKWATFDVYNGTERCVCNQQQTRHLYQYSIRHYGIYVEGNSKIKSLFSGRNQYTLWESYNDNNEMPYGKLMTGFVDGPGDCTTVPSEINDKAAAITVCDHQCVVAYEHIKCVGQRQTVQAYSGCRHVKLWNGLYKELSSVKGC